MASAPFWVLVGAAVAGTLDIVYAWVFWYLKAGVSMQRVLQSVAAGLLGRGSFSGGSSTATLGLALHYLIATAMSVTYYAAARRWPALVRYPTLCGAAYGLALYATMNYIVVPLSAAGRGSSDALWITASIVVHLVCIGVPIAFAARQALRLP